jgi:hypothetical protein
MIDAGHIPGAIAELAAEAARFRRKLPDLAHLTEPERWQRETPVKEALVRVKALIAEYHAVDREAQKDRDGPTEYLADDTKALNDNLAALKGAGEGDDAKFATTLPSFIGKVPEKLMLSAAEALALAVLPPNAFDSCRDPKACPTLPAPPPAPVSAPAPPAAARNATALCVGPGARPQDLKVRREPDRFAELFFQLRPRQCGIEPTGHKDAYDTPWGRSAWQQILVDGDTGWVKDGILVPEAGSAMIPQLAKPSTPFPPRVPPAGPRYCADSARLRGQRLPLRLAPDPNAPQLRALAPGTCNFTGTGRVQHSQEPFGRTLWLEVIDEDGTSGWVSAHYVRRP